VVRPAMRKTARSLLGSIYFRRTNINKKVVRTKPSGFMARMYTKTRKMIRRILIRYFICGQNFWFRGKGEASSFLREPKKWIKEKKMREMDIRNGKNPGPGSLNSPRPKAVDPMRKISPVDIHAKLLINSTFFMKTSPYGKNPRRIPSDLIRTKHAYPYPKWLS
jgi:hypothetical protein